MADREDGGGGGGGRRGDDGAHIIIIPPRSGATLNFKLSAWAFNFVLGATAALVVIFVGGVLITARMGAELRRLHAAEDENVSLRANNLRIADLESELKRLDDLRRQVLEMAGANPRTRVKSPARPGDGTSHTAGDVDRSLGASSSKEEPGKEAAPGEKPAAKEEATGEEPAVAVKEATATVAPPPQAVPGEKSPPKRWPVEGVVSKEFQRGALPAQEHHGIDIAAAHGAPVVAAGSGIVASAGQDSVFGQVVIIDHGQNIQTLYGHNSILEVGAGDWVREGQRIARVGSTGESSAPHLHFEVRRNSVAVDPREYLGARAP